MKRILQIAVCLLIFLVSYHTDAQHKIHGEAIKGAIRLPDHIAICPASDEINMTRVPNKNPKFRKFMELYREDPVNARSFQNSLKTAEIVVNFGSGFDGNEDAREAFLYAAALWELELVSSVPIVIDINIAPLGAGTIGSTGTARVINVPNAPDPSISYASSTANSIAGIDLLPGSADMSMNFNEDFNFYFGIDMNTPAGQTDFVTIALHEIGHGMGIFGNKGFTCEGVGLNNGVNPNYWDVLAVTGDGTPIMDLGWGSDAQQAALIGGDLFLNGFNAKKGLEGRPNEPRIYAPPTCSGGSSFSHWDEAEFPAGDPNSLMSPFNSSGEVIHDIGDFTRGYLMDIGWTLANRNPQFDIGVANIVAPENKPDLTNSEDITVQIGNRGNIPLSAVTVSYKIDDGDWIIEEFLGELAPGQEKQYTFTQKADLSVNSEYTIYAKVDYFIDEVKDNDEAYKVVKEVTIDPPDPISFPYSESFEDGPADWESSGLWELGAPSGSIISSASEGINAWVTDLGGNYPDETSAYLTSPTFNFTGYRDPLVEVDIWYDIETGWDGAAFQFSTDDGANWETVGEWGDPFNWYTDGPARSGTGNGDDGVDALTAAVNNGNGWTGTGADGSGGWITARHRVELQDESNVIFRFVFASDAASNNEGFAMDNIRITPDLIFDNDLTITDITGPDDGNLGSAETISALIKNVGRNEASNFDISYRIDGGSVITENIAGPLAPEGELTYDFTATADFSSVKLYDLEVFTALSGDENPGNDSRQVQVENILNVSAFPYRESFEGGNGNWKTYGTASSWELGVPNNTIIDHASDGSNAWVTSLNGDYNNSEVSFLESPGFNFTGFTEPVIGFDIWFEEEPFEDGVFVQYSVDNGGTWNSLGDVDDKVNWYNRRDLATNIVDQDNSFGWNWSSGGYWTSFRSAAELSGESFVIFRFAFVSNNSITNEGVAVDNVRVYDKSSINFTLECSAPVSANNDPGADYANLSPQNPVVNVGGSPTITISNSYNNSNDPTDNYPVGETFITYVVDVDGLLDYCVTKVTVTDNEPPVIECPDDVVVALETGQTNVQVSYEIPQATDNFGFSDSVTYSTRLNPVVYSPFTCTGIVDFSFIRAFDLIDDFDIDQDYYLESVDVGVEEVNDSEGVNARLNIYTFDQDLYEVTNPEEFIFANLEFLESENVRFIPSDALSLKNIPINTKIPAGKIAVVELFLVSDLGDFFPGTNPASSGESYTAGCGSSDITNVKDVDGIDLSAFQFIMRMNGHTKTTSNTELLSGLGSGQSFPIGVNPVSWKATDASELEGSCSFNVEVVSSSYETPVATDATGNTGTGFTANWDAVGGVTYYQLFVFELPLNTPAPGFDGIVVNGTSQAVTGLDPRSPYGYNVRAVDDLSPTQYSTLSNTIITTTVIPAPAGLAASDITDKSFKLKWNAVPGISQYTLDVSTDNFASFVNPYEDFQVSNSERNITLLSASTNYQVRVRAVNEGGASANSATLDVATFVSTPQALSSSGISSNTFTANWEVAAGAVSYRLDVTSDGFNTYVVNNQTVNGTTFEVNGLDPNTNYEYRVRSVDAGGTGLNSNTIRTTTHAVPAVALDPINSSSYGFTAAWIGSNGVSTFEFDLSTDDFTSVVPEYDGIVVNGTNILILGLEANTTYYYRVRAINRLGIATANSNTISFTTPDNTGDVPPAPVAGEATGIGLDEFTANWSGTNSIYYTLDVSSDNFSTYLNGFKQLQLFDDAITLSGLEEDSDYQYRVRAYNNSGYSGFSNVVNVRTILGIEDLANLEGITAYPNPVRDRFSLLIENHVFGAYEIRLFDHAGRLLNQRDFDKQEVRTSREVDLRFLPSGVYYVTVQTKSAAEVIRLIKK